MTQVDFYLVDDASVGAAHRTACRLARKAWLAGHQIYIYVPESTQVQVLDELLWTWSEGSFIPHARYPSSQAGTVRVLIGAVEAPAGNAGVLISLAPAVLPWFSRFERLVEIVPGDETQRQQARERFRFYRDRGYALDTHPVQN